MAVENEAPGREAVRRRVVEAATALLEEEGRGAVTTRAVAAAAGVQPPAIYRFFADMDALLDAVAERGYADFLAAKRGTARLDDPVADLRAGWDLAVEFGLGHPAIFVLMNGEPSRGGNSAAFQAGMDMLLARIRRLGEAGLLRVREDLAVTLIHAASRGAVLTWLSQPEDRRDPELLTAMRESMVAAVTTAAPDPGTGAAAEPDPGPAEAARALRAVLPRQAALSGAEERMLDEWLGRLASGAAPDER